MTKKTKKVRIQIKDISGNWITVQTVVNSDRMIDNAITSVQRSYKKDVRAVDTNGSLVQMYPYIKGQK